DATCLAKSAGRDALIFKGPTQALQAPVSVGCFQEPCLSDQAPAERISDGLFELLLAEAAHGHVKEGSKGSGYPKAGPLFHLLGGEGSLVEDAALGRRFPKCGRDRQMHCTREESAQLMEDKCRRVGDDRLGLVPAVAAPKGKPNQLVILSQR